MSHDCIAGSGVQLTEVACCFSSPLTSHDIQMIAGLETLLQKDISFKFPRELRF